MPKNVGCPRKSGESRCQQHGLLRENVVFFQVFEKQHGRLLRRRVSRVDGELRLERLFVGVVDAGEAGELAGAGFGAEASLLLFSVL